MHRLALGRARAVGSGSPTPLHINTTVAFMALESRWAMVRGGSNYGLTHSTHPSLAGRAVRSTPTDNGLLGSALSPGCRCESAQGCGVHVTSFGNGLWRTLTAGGVKTGTSLPADAIRLLQVRLSVLPSRVLVLNYLFYKELHER